MSYEPNSTNKRAQQLKKVQSEALDLFEKKNADYGDSFANYGPVGVIVRMGDKINRLSSVTEKGVNLVNTESVRDTLIDLHNYAAMAIMLLDEKHPRINEIKNSHRMEIPLAAKLRNIPFSQRRNRRFYTSFLRTKFSESKKCNLSPLK